MKNAPLYPFKFTPILQEKVWGGTKLKQLFGKDKDGIVGESWELSCVEGNISMLSNGELAGNTLEELIASLGVDLLGKKVLQQYHGKFPLLFKFIDAKQDLSVQLHPDDDLAKERHNSFGKTEMWYIMQAEKESRLILGFNEEMDKKKYEYYLSENRITDILLEEKVNVGDAYYISPGTVHAIGAGVVLAEIQQTSDITYRIYDWDRPGVDGQMRELHTQEAIAAIDYDQPDAKLLYSKTTNEPILLKKSDYFETNKLILTDTIHRDLRDKDSFVVYMCVDGAAIISAGDGSVVIQKGETVLIPAKISEVEIITKDASLLEVYIP